MEGKRYLIPLGIFLIIFMTALVSANIPTSIDQFNSATINWTLWNITNRGGVDTFSQSSLTYMMLTGTGNAGALGSSNFTSNSSIDLFSYGVNVTFFSSQFKTGAGGNNNDYLLIGNGTVWTLLAPDLRTDAGGNGAIVTSKYGNFWKVNSTTVRYSWNNSIEQDAYLTGNIGFRISLTTDPNTQDHYFRIDWMNASNFPLGVSTSLINPQNNSYILDKNTNFTVLGSATSGNLTNVTYYIWNSNGSLFNTTIVSTGGLNNYTNTTISNLVPGDYKWNADVCALNSSASICLSASPNFNRTFSYGYQINSVTFNSTTTETSLESFSLKGAIYPSISSIIAYLNYSGTLYSSTVSSSGINFTLSNSIGIPVGSSGSNSFNWLILFSGSNGNINVTTQNYTQTITHLALQYCESPSINGLTLNFTTFDSSNGTVLNELNSSFQGTFSFFALGGSGTSYQNFTFSDTNENRSNFMFCLNSSGLNATVNAFINYFATGYDSRSYIIKNGIIGNFTQNIPLYLASTASTDIVTFTVKDQNYNPLNGALVTVQEWNVGTGTYPTIGMFTTASDGTGILNLELYNIWYRAIVTYQGQIVQVTDVQKLSGTTWQIIVNLGINNPYDIFGSISHGLTFDNSTNITTFTWSDTSGYVQTGCLIVQNLTSYGYSEIFNSCLSTTAGIINYQLPGDGDYQIYGSIYLTSAYNVSNIVDTLTETVGISEITATVSPFGKVISFLFIGTSAFIGIAAGSVLWGVFLLIASIAGSIKLGWINMPLGIFEAFVVILIIILVRAGRKNNG